MSNNAYEKWWITAWSERERVLRRTFGDTAPSDSVIAFEWDDIELRIPGACALTFPPTAKTDNKWLTVTHGLTQPLEQCNEISNDRVSGYGYEFGVITNNREQWTIAALWSVLTYIRQSTANISRGHRLPIWFSTEDEIVLGKPTASSAPVGEMRAWLFWPHMSFPSGLDCSTGFFSVLVGTLITEPEWTLAKSTTSTHLLLMLFLTGVGQVSICTRPTITGQPGFEKIWREISGLTESEAGNRLLSFAKT